MMQNMMPFLLEMRYADMKSNNISYDLAERDNTLAEAQTYANFATDWIRSRKLFYMDVFSQLRKRIINLKKNSSEATDMSSSMIDETDNKMFGATFERDYETSKMMEIITSKLEKVICPVVKTIPKMSPSSTVTYKAKKVAFKTIEPIDGENASTSGINEITWKTEEINPEIEAQIQLKKANIVRTIIKSIIVSSNSVQKFNNIVFENAAQMLQDIHTKKIMGEKMKCNNVLTIEQSKSFKNDFNICITFAHSVRNRIWNIIEYIDKITEYLKLNEKELVPGKDDEFRYLANLQSELCEYIAAFSRTIIAGEEAEAIVEETRHIPLNDLSDQQSIDYEKIFYNHLSNIADLSQNFKTAWNASDAFADLLHCLFVLLVDDIDDFWSNLPQSSNCALFQKFNTNNVRITTTTNASRKFLAITSGRINIQNLKQITIPKATAIEIEISADKSKRRTTYV
uniref:Uncharacterized protein n=2 Tax=Loa loa TaxID=7209 RepID=A0A1I7W5P4_LOALO